VKDAPEEHKYRSMNTNNTGKILKKDSFTKAGYGSRHTTEL